MVRMTLCIYPLFAGLERSYPRLVFRLECKLWVVVGGFNKTERALKSINVAAKSNGLPLADHIPSDGDNKSEGEDITNAGMIGLMKKKKLLIRLIVMSLEWIGKG